jgi:hypothetical protein
LKAATGYANSLEVDTTGILRNVWFILPLPSTAC